MATKKSSVKKSAASAAITPPTVCTCPSVPEPHYHLPEGAIVVWDPVPQGPKGTIE